MDEIIKKLERVLLDRKINNTSNSYVSSLYAGGDELILKKITEEATEVIMAVKDNNNQKIIHEVADLYFHILVLLNHKNITTDKITKELSRRFGVSGLIEKKNRKE